MRTTLDDLKRTVLIARQVSGLDLTIYKDITGYRIAYDSGARWLTWRGSKSQVNQWLNCWVDGFRFSKERKAVCDA